MGDKVVINRNNIAAHQRAHWLAIAVDAGLPAVAVVAVLLQVSNLTCKERVMLRSGHPTLPPGKETCDLRMHVKRRANTSKRDPRKRVAAAQCVARKPQTRRNVFNGRRLR